jgi:dihydrofolate reductase
MRKLVMWNLLTLDGCFDGAQPWQLDWHTAAWGEELEQFSQVQFPEIGTLLFGRATY